MIRAGAGIRAALGGLVSNMVGYTQVVRTKDLDVSEQGLPMGKGSPKVSLG